MLRRKGEIEWVPLFGPLGGLEVGIEHVGPETHFRWMRGFDALRYRELPRIRKIREGLDDFKEVLPHLWPSTFDSIVMVSEEGRVEEIELARKALHDCVRAIRKDGIDIGMDPAACVAEIERWGLRDAMFFRAIEIQSLEKTDPLAESDRAPPVDGSAADSGHSGGGV